MSDAALNMVHDFYISGFGFNHDCIGGKAMSVLVGGGQDEPCDDVRIIITLL